MRTHLSEDKNTRHFCCCRCCYSWRGSFPSAETFLDNLQLCWERLSDKEHATTLKGIVGGFDFTVFKEIWKNDRRGHGHMSVSAKGKQQKKLVSTATVSGTVDCAYLILPFGNCRVHIFFDHLSRNSSLYLLAHTDGLIILSLRNINYWRPQSDSTVGGPFATRDSSQASPVRRDSSL